MGGIISAVLVLLVCVWIYVSISYLYNKKKNGQTGCSGDCSHCNIENTCVTEKRNE